MKFLEIFLLKLLILCLCLDFSGDYIILYSIYGLSDVNQFIRLLITTSLSLLLLFSLQYLKFIVHLNIGYKSVLFCIFAPIMYGFFWGIINNQTSLALREFLPYMTLLLIPLFCSFSSVALINIFDYFLKVLIILLLFKLALSQIIHLIYYGGFSWKVLLRISPLLMLPLSYLLYIFSTRRLNYLSYFYLVAVLIGIFLANARALFISSLSVALLSLSRINIFILFKLLFLVLVAVLLVLLFSDNDIFTVFGNWSGEAFDSSYGYRESQLEILFDRFLNYSISGVGFGYFTPGYESYEDLDNSYLLELDLLNFFTKIGLPFSIVYIFGFILFFYISIVSRIRCSQSIDLILKSFNSFLIGSLFYSLFQTFHSSILFWIFFSFAFSLNAKFSSTKFQ